MHCNSLLTAGRCITGVKQQPVGLNFNAEFIILNTEFIILNTEFIDFNANCYLDAAACVVGAAVRAYGASQIGDGRGRHRLRQRPVVLCDAAGVDGGQRGGEGGAGGVYDRRRCTSRSGDPLEVGDKSGRVKIRSTANAVA